ncbi:tRNA pseudouridine(38-40) synthase TruA [Spirosoma sp. 48-14]|uniref:tRNA pseudouridine(38-40) synthase TruA n=1 Tax=Spirosoma sp. 48-14 TaxID=1895854 RepID=UPI000964C472|nr:tRNA pseudouridine(38-40) synthase TruA [Spirosoma sp. 48-14]OJW75679.1 MAG: tRNA pseudouridine(38-40) synthase TruA [Spirosoma sp. 48-14]
MRYFIELSYRGTAYCGWQPQTVGVSIQATLEAALSQRLGKRVYVVGSGRTDAGVHARQQFAHFDTNEPLNLSEAFIYSLNCLLPEDIAIRAIFPVQETDHARFSAVFRYYQYHISRQKDVFTHGLSYHFRPWLNETLMNEACQGMLNYTNFQSFSKARANVNHFHCRLDFAYWERINEDCLTFHIRADRFLWGMVRTIVGTMLEIGQERMDCHQFEQIIQAKDRNAAGRAVPANGLYLVEVGYPEEVITGRENGARP